MCQVSTTTTEDDKVFGSAGQIKTARQRDDGNGRQAARGVGCCELIKTFTAHGQGSARQLVALTGDDEPVAVTVSTYGRCKGCSTLGMARSMPHTWLGTHGGLRRLLQHLRHAVQQPDQQGRKRRWCFSGHVPGQGNNSGLTGSTVQWSTRWRSRSGSVAAGRAGNDGNSHAQNAKSRPRPRPEAETNRHEQVQKRYVEGEAEATQNRGRFWPGMACGQGLCIAKYARFRASL